MITWLRRASAALAVALLALTLTAAPAHASTVSGCSDASGGEVCLYQWVGNSSGGGFWQRNKIWFSAQPNQCINLTNHLWNTGGTVYDKASSLIVNGQSASTSAYYQFYEWINAGGRNFIVPANGLSIITNLDSVPAAYSPSGGSDFNNTIASICLRG